MSSDRRDIRRVLDHDRFRKKREDDTISIRKQKREDLNLKRRMLAPSMEETLAADAQMMGGSSGMISSAPISAGTACVAVLAKAPVDGYDKVANPSPQELIDAFRSPNPADHLKAAHHIRRILSLGLYPFFVFLLLK